MTDTPAHDAAHDAALEADVTITTTGRKDAAAEPLEILGEGERARRGLDPLVAGDLAGGDAA